MKRSDMDDDSEWGINGKDLGNGQILKWPVVLSTSEYDVYQVEDHYVAFSCYASYGHNHSYMNEGSTPEEALQNAIASSESQKRWRR